MGVRAAVLRDETGDVVAKEPVIARISLWDQHKFAVEAVALAVEAVALAVEIDVLAVEAMTLTLPIEFNHVGSYCFVGHEVGLAPIAGDLDMCGELRSGERLHDPRMFTIDSVGRYSGNRSMGITNYYVSPKFTCSYESMSDRFLYPTPEQIIATHQEVEDTYDLKYTGARVAAPKLKLKRIQERNDLETLYLKAAFLLRKLITSHLFEDGNKRTAWLTTRKYLDEYGEEPAERGPETAHVLRRIRRYDIEEIAEWLETGEIDESRLRP